MCIFFFQIFFLLKVLERLVLDYLCVIGKISIIFTVPNEMQEMLTFYSCNYGAHPELKKRIGLILISDTVCHCHLCLISYNSRTILLCTLAERDGCLELEVLFLWSMSWLRFLRDLDPPQLS